MLDLTRGWPVQRRATHDRIRLRPLPTSRTQANPPAVVRASTSPPDDGEQVAAHIVALCDAVLSGRCAPTALRAVTTESAFRQFCRLRHRLVDATRDPVRLRLSSVHPVGKDRLEVMATLSTSGLVNATVHNVEGTWRLSGCALVRQPRQRDAHS
ncbi:MAG TPA: hypothetical protein H9881_00725 [Candidatus Stackebrandtia excrementipullorum]|nr:hypothetical protein [Candidatus Stackebrandtia excrementipullorum]